MRSIMQKWGKHIAAVAVFLVLTVVYFAPAVFEGKSIRQGDMEKAVGMGGSQMEKYEKSAQPGEFSVWSKNPGLWKLLFPIIYSGAIGIYVLVLVFGIGMTLAGSAVNQNVTGAGMSVLAFFFMYFVVIIVSILFGAVQIALNVLVNKQIYENFAEGNMPVIHAVLSSLVPLYEAICLFIMRKRPFVR